MLPAQHRFSLAKNPLFFQNAQKKHFRYFYVFWEDAPAFSTPVIGVTVSKTTEPQSVKRNTVKRRVKSIIRQHLSEANPVTALFILKKNACTATYADLKQDIAIFFSASSN